MPTYHQKLFFYLPPVLENFSISDYLISTRLAANILVTQLGQPLLSWSSLVAVGELRKSYVSALQSADREDIGPLLVFARS
jgi:hypothetical protein